MLGEAIKYPMNRDDWVKQYIIGVALIFFFWLIIPVFILGGYYINVLRQTEAGNEEPPAFGNWGKLIIDGLKALVIAIGYFLIPTILFMVVAVFMGGLGVLVSGGSNAAAAGISIVAILLLLVTFLVALVIVYVYPAALVNFAKHDSIGKAFDFGTIKNVAFTSDYFIAWILAFLVNFVANIITNILFITIIGIILIPFVAFYSAVVVQNLYGRGFAKAQT